MADKTIKMLLVGEDRSASKALQGVGDQADKAQGRLKSFGAAGALAIAGAATAVVAFGAKTVESASRAEQAAGGVGAVFGDQAAQITKAAEGAAQSLGLSETAYSELATTLGAGLKNKGIEDYADKTQDLLVVGADLAAQFGGSTADAVGALSSALRGETDPIERYGVAMNQAAIEAKALSMGLGTSTVDADKVAIAQKRAEVAQMSYNEAVKKHGAESKEATSASASMLSAQESLEKAMAGGKTTLTEQEKATAALALITEQTSTAQGAFGRESETLAGKQQRLTAEFENAQSELGSMLLPVLTDLAGVLMDVVVYVKENADWLGPLAAGFGAVTAAVWLVNAALAANPIGLVVIAIAALVAGLVVAYNESETFRSIVDGAFRAIGDAGAWLWNNALQPALVAIVEGFAWVTDGLADMLDALGTIPGFGWAKDAAGYLRGVAENARAAADGINKIPDRKTVNINVIQRVSTIQQSSGRTVVGAGVNLYEADGGVVRYYANGGMERHVAQIAPAGAMRVWAEPETGGEAYIPLASSKRAQSLEIWRETGRLLGVQGFAGGGIAMAGGVGAMSLSGADIDRIAEAVRAGARAGISERELATAHGMRRTR